MAQNIVGTHEQKHQLEQSKISAYVHLIAKLHWVGGVYMK